MGVSGLAHMDATSEECTASSNHASAASLWLSQTAQHSRNGHALCARSRTRALSHSRKLVASSDCQAYTPACASRASALANPCLSSPLSLDPAFLLPDWTPSTGCRARTHPKSN